MRILFTIVHCYNPQKVPRYNSQLHDPTPRIHALTTNIFSIKNLLCKGTYCVDIAKSKAYPANQSHRNNVDIIICTTKNHHLIDKLAIDKSLYTHHNTNVEPLLLGFECHDVLKDNLNKYDYYCYLEDDIILLDPFFFAKLNWFNKLTENNCLLLPNRYEIAFFGLTHKAYMDGDIDPIFTSGLMKSCGPESIPYDMLGESIVIKKPLNPHSGCFFLNAEQMSHWASQPYFLDRDTSFVGPLESAASLSTMKTFTVYKPDFYNADFFEVMHFGFGLLCQIGNKFHIEEEVACP